ncbi:MarR family winged helix-turn-helix transcriptional regulator [Halalkalibacter nanhaiisediminis]|uniref:DNA-binding MarR family transcriptional regulator n=1 Tax=Halalkalibacter nanhaiisediminis TaxID=688079 RepID=A0A562QR57_9BACI|nr:MarR family transcriptional regulator [Halalkalibacter nanhaiisediminis]TWI59185.1 DNA-binding MarR family transcriptional regulator [Halalkalibacter nanhaiisediminis]
MRNLDDRVGYHIGIVAHLMQNKFNQKLSEFGLTVAQSKVLFLLVQHGEQLQSELQNRLYIKASTMNGIIDSMLKKGLIEKIDSTLDRRQKQIVLTEKGELLEERLWDEVGEMDDSLMKGFLPEERQLFLAWLRKISNHLQQ